jgi:hypothetical protein
MRKGRARETNTFATWRCDWSFFGLDRTPVWPADLAFFCLVVAHGSLAREGPSSQTMTRASTSRGSLSASMSGLARSRETGRWRGRWLVCARGGRELGMRVLVDVALVRQCAQPAPVTTPRWTQAHSRCEVPTAAWPGCYPRDRDAADPSPRPIHPITPDPTPTDLQNCCSPSRAAAAPTRTPAWASPPDQTDALRRPGATLWYFHIHRMRKPAPDM